jgi:hypothetical protein
MITIIVIMNSMLFIIINWITIHFGRNPKNGGSPPSDNNDMNIMNFISFIFSLTIIT